MFDINLLRNQVDPLRRRKLKHVMMHIYLLAWGSLLVVVAYATTDRLLMTNRRRSDIKLIETEFNATHPEVEKSMEKFAKSLQHYLYRVNETLVSMDTVFKNRVPMGEIILGLATCLPPESHIMNAAWDASDPKRLFTFDVVVPGRGKEHALQPEELIRKWRREAALTGRLEHISSTATERRYSGETSASVFRFNCRLAIATEAPL